MHLQRIAQLQLYYNNLQKKLFQKILIFVCYCRGVRATADFDFDLGPYICTNVHKSK